MEDQAANLDTLARGGVRLVGGISKGRVRDTSGATIRLAVEALDQEDFLRRQPLLVVPALARRVAHPERLALAVRVDQPDGHEFFLAHAVRVGYGQGIPLDRLDGSPDIDDLHPALEELGGFLGGKVVRHARERG